MKKNKISVYTHYLIFYEEDGKLIEPKKDGDYIFDHYCGYESVNKAMVAIKEWREESGYYHWRLERLLIIPYAHVNCG